MDLKENTNKYDKENIIKAVTQNRASKNKYGKLNIYDLFEDGYKQIRFN